MSATVPTKGSWHKPLQIRSHRDLIVWQKAMELASLVCGVTSKFPRTERYALVAQLRRSAASIPANIAEGHARGTRKDYLHFVSLAQGSLMEVDTHLTLAIRVGYLNESQAGSAGCLITEISKMLSALRARLRE